VPAFLLRPPGIGPFRQSRRHSSALQFPTQQTVDGCHAALEIAARSSYVPSTPIGVRFRFSRDARPSPFARLELPVWMK
jgi:hypothetical protein